MTRSTALCSQDSSSKLVPAPRCLAFVFARIERQSFVQIVPLTQSSGTPAGSQVGSSPFLFLLGAVPSRC